MHAGRRLSARFVGAAAFGTGSALWYQEKYSPAHAFFWASGPAFDAKKVREDVVKVIDEHQAGPVFVRLAWHAAGTYDKKSGTGGNCGSMRFAPESGHGANAGLKVARDLLEPVKAANPKISYADLWCLASCIAIEEAGGPKVPFRYGRVDCASASGCPPDGRLPGADFKGAAGPRHARDIFERMGFNDQEIIALMGAHALGHCHKDRSGYVGPWTHDPYSFSNEWYRLLLEYNWQVKSGSSPEQFEDSNTKTLMMLPLEIALKTDSNMMDYIVKYAEDGDLFYKDFSAAYQKLMELGAKGLKGPIDY
eukprot:TRINITY_DN5064_c0_g1_i1.p1 TRINITY_DN5064_c0_g1~~TRINITY_DN5064_c0_g1_i1.p1  ORF type:complete len:308 (+),score=85.75 TRINITY_DN5064_c0_g1_i1:61-984(+)